MPNTHRLRLQEKPITILDSSHMLHLPFIFTSQKFIQFVLDLVCSTPSYFFVHKNLPWFDTHNYRQAAVDSDQTTARKQET